MRQRATAKRFRNLLALTKPETTAFVKKSYFIKNKLLFQIFDFVFFTAKKASSKIAMDAENNEESLQKERQLTHYIAKRQTTSHNVF
jgi:hypothetical protein